MELTSFTLDCNQEPSTTLISRDWLEHQSSERNNVYDPAQDILDTCNRDLEELRMKVLKTSVRCHMLEVDLATQFNPRNQQLYVDAQESCRECSEAVSAAHQVVAKLTASQAPQKQQISNSNGLSEEHDSLGDIAKKNAEFDPKQPACVVGENDAYKAEEGCPQQV